MPAFASRVAHVKPSAIREILELTQQTDVISFAGGLPAPNLFPVARIREAAQHVLGEEGRNALQYSATGGWQVLREALAAQTDGGADPDDILIVSGSQQALDLVGKLMIDPGDTVIVESPTYMGALRAFDVYQPTFVAVGSDDDGMDLVAVEAAMVDGARLVYVNPNFANPTGRTMSLARRQGLVDLARRHDVLIYEDDPYRLLRFEGEPVPTLRQLAPDLVIYAGSLSKVLVPGFRLGWIVAPKAAMTMLNRLKQATDLHTSTFTQAIAAVLLDPTFMAAHIKEVGAYYLRQRDLMLARLEETFPSSASWTRPQGGMFVWVSLAETVDTEALLPRAVERGAAFVPGAPFHPTGGGHNTMRLSYSVATPDEITRGVAAIATLL